MVGEEEEEKKFLNAGNAEDRLLGRMFINEDTF